VARVFFIDWTTSKSERRVKTKKRASELMAIWKRWYERQGWDISGKGSDEGYIARPPGWRDDPIASARHAIILREYDGAGERIRREPKIRATATTVASPDEVAALAGSVVVPARQGCSTPEWA
jgi:hypothetical protein